MRKRFANFYMINRHINLEGKMKKNKKGLPYRHIFAILLTSVKVLALIIGIYVLNTHLSYLCIIIYILQGFCVIYIIASNDNPEYKIPWLIVVFMLPKIGFLFYFFFYRGKLNSKQTKRLITLKKYRYSFSDQTNFSSLYKESTLAYLQAKMLCNISNSHLFTDTEVKYFPSGESALDCLIIDLNGAKEFIYMEYFTISFGVFWDLIHEILVKKAKAGLDVRVIYDDVGCMSTLPACYYKTLNEEGINCVPFSKLKGRLSSEFNNRTHRKITVIDGKVAYTGGVNIADEYINAKKRFGYWKDCMIRLKGSAVYEFTKLFIIDFGLNEEKLSFIQEKGVLYPKTDRESDGYVVPFGCGPKPFYKHRIASVLIENLIETATESVFITTPYLIIDNNLCNSLENASLRGVKVGIIVPYLPDKKTVFQFTKIYCERLLNAGVKIYQYTPGFIHSKCYLVDGKSALVGTVNLDYRSLVHHYENGVWIYGADCIRDIKEDMEKVMLESRELTREEFKSGKVVKWIVKITKIFSPLM